MSSMPSRRMTPEEYLAFERKAQEKHEFLDGQVFTLAGCTERHNLIVVNLITQLAVQLRKRPCKVYPSDMRVKIPKTGLYTYPDIVVACGDIEFEDVKNDTLLNPTLIVEVLSETTEAYDRGKKFEHYRRIESLQEYLLISQDQYKVEQFVKQKDGRWIFSEITDHDGTARLSSVDCELSVAEVYAKVTFA